MTVNETIAKALGIEGRITGYSGTVIGGVVESRVEKEFPLYDADLDLIHSAEDALTEEECEEYINVLADIVDPDEKWKIPQDAIDILWLYRHATAAQCAEALANVLEGRK